jgi:tetratricopeptide (TPR) repeat protein
VDVDKKEGRELFSTFNGTVMPTLIFLDGSGNEIDRIIGYLPPEQYQIRVAEIEGNVNTLGACIHKYENGERTAHLLFTMAQKYTDRNESDTAKKYYVELLESFPDVGESMSSTARFELAYDEFKGGNIDPFNEFVNKFSTSHMAHQALSLMARFYKSSDNKVSELGVYARMLELYPHNPHTLNGYAWRMTEMELNLEDALAKARYAVELTVTDKDFQAGILDTEAEVLWKLGRFNDAILTIEKSLRIDPSSVYFMDQKIKFVNAKKDARKHVPA